MTAEIQVSEAPTTGIGKMILENTFFVPTHQRDYKWDQDKVQRFFDDLTEAMDRDDRFYFVGLMVFMREGTRLRVLDGQQRLATTIILLSALRAWFAEAEQNSAVAQDIQRDFIGRSDYGETEPRPKMSLNLNNDDIFQRFVTGTASLESIRAELSSTGPLSPNSDLLSAIIYLHVQIRTMASKQTSPAAAAEYFNKFIKFIRESVVSVRLTVPNESNAFRVFETLNDRGMELSAFDLLKNFLFGLSYERGSQSLKQIEHRWSQLTQTLQESNEDDFLKVYWTSRHGLTQLNQIYDAVKRKVKTSAMAEALSIDMLEAAEYYTAIDDPEDAVWHPQSGHARSLLQGLRALGSKLARPAIISGAQKLEVPEFTKLLQILEVVIVRWQVIGAGRTGTIERLLARLAAQIWDEKISKGRDFIKTLEEIYPSDRDFQTKFSTQEGLTNKKAAYILRRIEMHERGNSKGAAAKELLPSHDLTIEHIFPRAPGDSWKKEMDADKGIIDMTYRIGNLCLLTTRMNKSAAIDAFENKKKIYEKSDLITTQKVAESDRWNADAISQRQTWLASKAVSIWRFPT